MQHEKDYLLNKHLDSYRVGEETVVLFWIDYMEDVPEKKEEGEGIEFEEEYWADIPDDPQEPYAHIAGCDEGRLRRWIHLKYRPKMAAPQCPQ